MKLHFDKFTIAVLVVVGVLLAAAIFTVSRTNNSSEPAAYLTLSLIHISEPTRPY